MKSILAMLLLAYTLQALAGWESRVEPEHRISPGLALITYSPNRDEGAPTFQGALDALAREGHIQRLEGISLHWLVKDEAFQRELMTALRTSAPKELADALASAGNMHNPKMRRLRRPFEAAVLDTPTIKQINADLARYGLHVSGASTEKLSLVNSSGERMLTCFLWLQVSKHRQ